MNHLIRSRVVPPVTTPCRSGAAVQHELDGEVDVVPLAVPRDLDPIHERRDGPVGPARPAVVGNVLVEVLRQVGLPVDVVPVPVVGNVLLGKVPVGWELEILVAADIIIK